MRHLWPGVAGLVFHVFVVVAGFPVTKPGDYWRVDLSSHQSPHSYRVVGTSDIVPRDYLGTSGD
jgi:hypothetical protein